MPAIGNAIGIPFKRGQSNVQLFIPESADALFSLYTVVGDNCIDGVNGWLFPITGKDWSDDEGSWEGFSNILPFKSSCTISAPADAGIKAIIQPYDTDNFWYDVGGTPNEIPIFAFFQNINFSNKYFCKHNDHVVNGDLEEITPSGISDITLYKSARVVSAAFTTFYGSDALISAVNTKFVSKAGNDAAGDGSFANPWLTIDKGLTTMGTGKTLWVLSGDYNEASAGHDFLSVLVNNTTLTIKGCGNVNLLSANAGLIFQNESYSSTINVYGVRFKGYKSIYFNYPPANWGRCYFEGSGWGNSGLTGSIIKSVIKGDNANATWSGTHRVGFLLSECYNDNTPVTISINTNSGKVHYCKSICSGTKPCFTYGTYVTSFEFKYNYMRQTGTANCIGVANCIIRTSEHLDVIERNVFESNYPAINYYPSDASTTSWVKLECKYNKFIDYYVNEAGTTCFGIIIPNGLTTQRDSEIEYNYFKSTHTGNRNAIIIVPGGAYAYHIKYNRFFMDNTVGTIISFGEGGSGSIDGTEVIGNFFRGCFYNYPGASVVSSTHGLLANGGINFIIKYNWFEYLPLGLVVKANNGLNYNAAGVSYNVFFNNHAHFYYRRVEELNTYNNTFVNTTKVLSRIGAIDEQAYACLGHLLGNNIFTYNANEHLFSIANSLLTGADNILFDNNIFPDDEDLHIINDMTTNEYFDYDEAVAHSYITNGGMATPDFVNQNLGNLSLNDGSSGRGDGSDLGAGYDDGLDVTSDWNNDVTDEDVDNYPNIVTKQQGANWDKGAYVH